MANQSIALGVRPPSVPNLGGIAAQNMNIMNQIVGMKRAQAEQENQNYMRQAGATLDMADPAAVQQFIAQGGPAAAQMVNATQQAQTSQINLQDKQHAQGVKLLGGAFRSILNDPSDANLDAVAQTLTQAKVPPEMIEQELGAIRRLPVEQRGGYMQKIIMSDPQNLEIFKLTQPKPQMLNLRDRNIMVDINPLSPTFNTELNSYAVGKTPHEAWQEENPQGKIVQGEDGFYSIDTRTGTAKPITVGSGTPTGRAGTVSVESLRPAVIAQESGGDYTARNSSTGALGAYQIMPATGRALAERLGIQWMPGLMTKNTPEARKYQDAIGTAALEEAVAASGGDPMVAAAYYHGGSDRNKWGPKTQKYAQEVTGRMGGAAPATAGMGSAPGQQLKPKQAAAAQAKQTRPREDEAKVATNVSNMISASKELAQIIQDDPSAMAPGGMEYAASGVPFYGDEAARWFQSGARQRFNAGLEKVLSAVTYINTGSGVSEAQMEGYRRSYFPTIQDTPRTRQSKMQGLVKFIRDAKSRAGAAWTPEMDQALNELESIFNNPETFNGPSKKTAPKTPVAKPKPKTKAPPPLEPGWTITPVG